MALSKKERRITIAIGLIIGVSTSSMLVKHALEVKDQQTARKPGNYASQQSAVDQVKFPPLPRSIIQSIPNGIVVFFEENRSRLSFSDQAMIDAWIIETSGSFRSERLFILAEVNRTEFQETRFFRASEIYVKLKNEYTEELFNQKLDDEEFRIIGKNSSSDEYIVQVKEISPTDLISSEKLIRSMPMVESTRFPPWIPSR